MSGLKSDDEGCAEDQRGVRSKGIKAVKEKGAATNTDDEEWTMSSAPRRAKATYKRSRNQRGGRRSCSQIKEIEKEDDAMEVDTIPEVNAAEDCSTGAEEAKPSGRYTLRNRDLIRKLTDNNYESLASTVPSSAARKKRPGTKKKKKEIEEEAWWETANAVRIIPRIFASLTPLSLAARNGDALSDCDCRRCS